MVSPKDGSERCIRSGSGGKRFDGLWLNASPVMYCMNSTLPRVGSSHGVSRRGKPVSFAGVVMTP